MRYIPKSSKVKMKIYKSLTLADIMVMGIGMLLVALVVSSGVRSKWVLALCIVSVFFVLMIPLDENRIYPKIIVIVKYLAKVKRYGKESRGIKDINALIPYEKIEDDLIVNKDGSFVSVLEVSAINLFLMDEYAKRTYTDHMFANIVKSAGEGQQIIFFKIEEPITFLKEIKEEEKRIAKIQREEDRGILSDKERQIRVEIVKDRMAILEMASKEERIRKNRYYIAFIDFSKEGVKSLSENAKSRFSEKNIGVRLLKEAEISGILKKMAVAAGEVKFSPKNMSMGDKNISFQYITGFPSDAEDGWLSAVFSVPNTCAYMRIVPLEKALARKSIDRSILEVGSCSGAAGASQEIGKNAHEESLRELLYEIEDGRESVAEIEVILSVFDEKGDVSRRKEARRKISEAGFSSRDLTFMVEDGYMATLLRPTDCIEKGNAMPSSVIASAYPFVGDSFSDSEGVLIGENSAPVFLDIFRRDKERVNSNMVIVGRSGSGKSYAAKTILAGLVTCGVRVFILDPEGEYSEMVKNLGGEVLNASSNLVSKINPFEIFVGLQEDSESYGAFYTHLQFLEEMYKLIFPDVFPEVLDRLNRLTSEMYRAKGITDATNFSLFTHADYPTFDDLSDFITEKIKKCAETMEKTRLLDVYNLLSKVRPGGSMYALWNGETTFHPDKNLLAYNFQSLIAGKNPSICNAQMLLVLKTMENEILKNREMNIKNRTDNKICVVIDEAHVFIDEKYPASLDFIYSLAKRIRKYDGMLMVITQNIKDFTGSSETAKKTSAIINASQYSLIFSLNPGDMADLVELYSKAGEITEEEREGIIKSPRGRALLIAGHAEHTFLDIVATKKTSKTWENWDSS